MHTKQIFKLQSLVNKVKFQKADLTSRQLYHIENYHLCLIYITGFQVCFNCTTFNKILL